MQLKNVKKHYLETNIAKLRQPRKKILDFSNHQTAKTVKIGDHTLDVNPNEKLKFSLNEKTKELTIKTVDIFKEY
jgi:hypothetical protein